MLDTAVTDTATLLVYDDLEAVREYLVRVFGLTAGPLTRMTAARSCPARPAPAATWYGCTRPPAATGSRAASARLPA